MNEMQENKASGVSVAALILGICGFFCNPLSLVTLTAIFLGIVGIATAGKRPKGMAITGLCLGIAAAICQLITDLILSVFTLGMSFLI